MAKVKQAKPKKKKASVMNGTAKSKKSDQSLKIKVPNLTIPATGGKSINLKDLKPKRVVLYFYPKDMTPGCTLEGHEFSKLKNKFAKFNTIIFGVSRDTVASHEKFCAKEGYTIDLLSDADEKLCRAFDVIKDKNMYGRIVKGIERSTFLINESGEVVQEWRKVKAEGHAHQVLSYLETL